MAFLNEPHHEADDAHIHLLSGHSGALIILRETAQETYVRKQARQTSQNGRLEAQANKQDRFYRSGGPCPRVLGMGTVDGCFYFDMEYLAGTSVAHQCQGTSIPDRGALISHLREWIGHFAASADGELGASAFLAKVASIRQAAHANPALRDMRSQIDRFSNALCLADWSGIPASDCHGDLTLENIMVTRSGYRLIDLDVPDLSSYFLDVAKLFQDIDGHWCLRGLAMQHPDSVQHLNAQQNMMRVRASLMPMIEAVAPGIIRRLPTLVALHLMRVLPYCREEAVARYTVQRIAATMHLPA